MSASAAAQDAQKKVGEGFSQASGSLEYAKGTASAAALDAQKQIGDSLSVASGSLDWTPLVEAKGGVDQASLALFLISILFLVSAIFLFARFPP